MGYPVRLKLIINGLLVYFTNQYTTGGAHSYL